jgi:predicted nucleotidyltransferase
MDILEEDSLSILKALCEREVSFILVGGIAVIYYGYNRSTGDIDIWLEDTPTNREKFVAALNDYGIGGSEIFMNLPLMAGYSEIMLDSGIYLDIMADLTKFTQADFKACYQVSEDWEFQSGIHVKVLHLNQLIHEKEGNTRLKDKDDLEHLKMIRDRV